MRAPEHRRSQRGAVIVFVALVLAVLLGFLGFVLNGGHATSVRGELQNASDAAALAGAAELNGTTGGVAAARDAADQLATAHRTDTTQSVTIDRTNDVRFCNWNPATRTIAWCLPYGSDPTTAPPPVPTPGAATQLQAANAVQVRDGRETSRGNALPVWLSASLGGTASLSVSSSATAVGGGPYTVQGGCLPIAYVDCALPGYPDVCDQPIIYRNNNMDTAGFTLLTDSMASASAIANFLRSGQCPTDYPPGGVTLNNGSISASTVWSLITPGYYQMPIVHTDDPACKINGSMSYPIVTFVEIHITGVYRSPHPTPPADCADASGRIVTPCIVGTVDCHHHADGSAGGLFLGLPAPPQLVQ